MLMELATWALVGEYLGWVLFPSESARHKVTVETLISNLLRRREAF